MNELNLAEIEEVSGGKVNVRMVAEGGVLLIAGGLALATGGFALVAVGTVAAGAGAGWGFLGFAQ